jgi:ankyrin repeat protein
MKINDLPKVLIVHLCLNFFDLDSILNFSSTNKNFNSYFSEFRKAHFYFNQIQFFKNYIFDWKKNTPKTKEEEKKFLKKLLIEGDYSKLNNFYGFNFLHIVCRSKNISMEMIKHFVENKADLNDKNQHGETPFHYACENEDISLEMIKYLVENKANLSEKNKYKVSSFHYACSNKNISLEMIKYFVENKADLNDDSYLDFFADNNRILENEIFETYGETFELKQIIESFQKK